MIQHDLHDAIRDLLTDVFGEPITVELSDTASRIVIQQIGELDQKETSAICMRYGIASRKFTNKEMAEALSTPSVTHALGFVRKGIRKLKHPRVYPKLAAAIGFNSNEND